MALVTTQRAVALVPQLSKLTPEQLDAHLEAASVAIESACGRKFARATVVKEVVRTDCYGFAWLERSPVVTGTLVLTDLEETAIARWQLDTESGELKTPRLRDAFLLASYQGGFVTIPHAIELAVSTLAIIDSGRVTNAASGDVVSKEIGKVKVTYASGSAVATSPTIPKPVMDMIAPYVIPRLV